MRSALTDAPVASFTTLLLKATQHTTGLMVKVAPLLPPRDLLSSQRQLRWTHTCGFALLGQDVGNLGLQFVSSWNRLFVPSCHQSMFSTYGLPHFRYTNICAGSIQLIPPIGKKFCKFHIILIFISILWLLLIVILLNRYIINHETLDQINDCDCPLCHFRDNLFVGTQSKNWKETW